MAYMNFENGKTALNDTNLNNMQVELMKLVFPIGSPYITQENTNPSTILKFGTWERLKGKVCLGVDEDDEDFKTIGNTGGEKTHILTSSELPLGIDGQRNSDTGSDWQKQGVTTKTAKAFSVMQPYEVVGYMWIRRS